MMMVDNMSMVFRTMMLSYVFFMPAIVMMPGVPIHSFIVFMRWWVVVDNVRHPVMSLSGWVVAYMLDNRWRCRVECYWWTKIKSDMQCCPVPMNWVAMSCFGGAR